MSTRVRVGDVEVRVEADLTSKQIRALLRTCAGIALGLAEASPPEDKPVIGFTAPVLERLPDDIAPEPEPLDD